jgi:hypothetical protein
MFIENPLGYSGKTRVNRSWQLLGGLKYFSRQTAANARDTTTPEYSATLLINAAISDKLQCYSLASFCPCADWSIFRS